MENIFDTHAHYDDEAFKDDLDETLMRVRENGVALIINCGCDEESSKTALSLAEKYDFIFAAVGIHPENADEGSVQKTEIIRELATHPKAVAIGEIGLDYYWDTSKKELQKKVFEKQLILSKELDMPVIIHDREAHGDTMELLRRYRPKGVLHCFSGSAEMAKEAVALGMYIGFGGALTFKNAKKPSEAAKAVPLDRLLLETDCPYMAPVPMRGRRNESHFIGYVAEKMGKIKELPPQDVINAANENGKRLFFGEK